jgi:hypothetical protein
MRPIKAGALRKGIENESLKSKCGSTQHPVFTFQIKDWDVMNGND